MRAQLQRKLLFVVTSVDSYSLKSHPSRVFNYEVAQSADAVHSDKISGTSTRLADCVVNRITSTHVRSGLFCQNFIRNRGQPTCRCAHVLRTSSIEVNARN